MRDSNDDARHGVSRADAESAVRTLLRIALAQTLVLETPAFAAVSTAVKLAERDPKTRPYKNLVNAVLRGVGRDGPGLTTAESNLPDWLAQRWKAAEATRRSRAARTRSGREGGATPVIPGLAEGESPESIGPHHAWSNGFRVLASRAPE